MKRVMIYALAAGISLGSGSLAYAQYGSGSGSTRPPAGAGATGQPGMGSSPGQSQVQQIPESEVVAALEQHGYTNVSDVKQRGDKITAKAMKNGKQEKLEIDTSTGTMKTGG